jgi:serine/threonine protein kinase
MKIPPNISQVIGVKSNREFRVLQLLSSGGQGGVYVATCGPDQFAIKWYFQEQATKRQKFILENLIQHLSRDETMRSNKSFVWPQELVTSPDAPGFGYVMDLLPSDFHALKKYVNLQIKGIPFKLRHQVAFETVSAFANLNLSGLAYGDISLDNIHFHPTTGAIKIIDNDNVVPIGKAGNILGTPGFQAPEIETGELKRPNLHTDLHSLAVILFYIFFQGHPLSSGKRELKYHIHDYIFNRLVYGTDPIFIHHPTDTRNRPVKEYHLGPLILWHTYPWFIKELFFQNFIQGLKNPRSRIRSNVWKRSIKQLDNMIFSCQNCGREAFFHADKHKNRKTVPCWKCKKPVQSPKFRLEQPDKANYEKDVIVLDMGTQLFPHHLDKTRVFDFSEPLAQVVAKPQNPDTWGLKNLTKKVWDTRTRSGNKVVVKPGRSAVLNATTTIDFGTLSCQVKRGNEQ